METLLLTLHIIGAGIFVGIVVFSFLLILWKPFNQERLKVLLLIRNIGIYAAILQTVTGILLYFREPGEFRDSLLFWIKIGLFVLDGLVAVLYVDRKIKINLTTPGKQPFPTLFWTILVAVNIIVIFAIIALGVMIAH